MTGFENFTIAAACIYVLIFFVEFSCLINHTSTENIIVFKKSILLMS